MTWPNEEQSFRICLLGVLLWGGEEILKRLDRIVKLLEKEGTLEELKKVRAALDPRSRR
jgi:hypothetical protein